MIAWVDSLLCRWGQWAIARATSGLGYPAVSPTFRDYRPPTGEVYTRFDPGFTESEIVACDIAINALPPVPRVVVVAHYQLGRGWTDTAKRVGISRQAAKAYVDEAQRKIAAHIDEKKSLDTSCLTGIVQSTLD